MAQRAVHTFAAIVSAVLLSACLTSTASPSPPATEPGSPIAAGSTQPSPVPTTPPVPSSQALIAADLAAGKIDLATSLRLRAWTLFGDPRLPEAYDGSGSSGEDQGLFRDIADNLASLPADTHDELSGYLMRPTDPHSPFSSAPPTASTGGMRLAAFDTAATEGLQLCVAPQRWFNADWSPDGSADLGFRAWACGVSQATVQDDLNTVLAVGSRLWVRMTIAEPDGMGLPVSDLTASQNDGNGKVDVYLLEPLAECRLRGALCRDIGGDAVAAATIDWPANCGINGFPARGCSGYLLLGRGRLGDPAFAADFAHEFFHVLQFAHNGQIDPTWYEEASAVWAEWYYEREAGKTDDYGHFQAYQAENRSLLWYDSQAAYQYQAWGWPLFQSTQGGAKNVFQTWSAIESAVTKSEVDAAVNGQFEFATTFRDFAVRNAQPEAYLPPASKGLEADSWQTKPDLADFPTEAHLVTSKRSAITLGKDSHPADIDPLTAQYDEYEVVDNKVRQIEIDITKLSGAGQADLDALAQIGAGGGDTWHRFSPGGGKLKLCRDKPDQNVNTLLEVVISNHLVARDGNLPDLSKRVSGNYTIEAKDKCDQEEPYLAGTITWNATQSTQYRATTISGRAELVLHGVAPGTWVAERGEGSSYTYDVNISICQPDGHLSGTIESGVGVSDPSYHIGNVNALNTDVTDTADLEHSLNFYDQWDVTCTDQYGNTYPEKESAPVSGFPGCTREFTVTMKNDGTGNYSISCDIALRDDPTFTGHIAGELHPIQGPTSSP